MRCDWANGSQLEKDYHDYEWGKAVHDDQRLFEMLVLESMQSGLSWSTILNKRDNFRQAFDHFEIKKVASYDEEKYLALMNDPTIVRHPLKIKAAIHNAQLILDIQAEYGSFDDYFWRFNDYQIKVNHWQQLSEVPATTVLSDEISRTMKKSGFKFIGSTTIYAFMQAIGMVNDHLESCDYK